METVKHREKYSDQRNATVSEDEVVKMLLEAVRSTQFEGVTVSRSDAHIWNTAVRTTTL